MKNLFVLALATLALVAGCNASEENATATASQATVSPASAQNCTTTGPDSPIVVGENSVVVVDGKTFSAGQSADCMPGSGDLSTHGANSPIVTGSGAKVIIRTDR
ncbi:TPA: hypothetical protein L5C20_006708 [Pseudomonas aeruginosa]|nr:hypothetical protein [Pseudomonas aeruginosa]HBO8747615.1 hypothetical protein [Pseudomonas aeruginosa]